MILSASRRSDLPAFYADWLLSRLKKGSVLVPQPRRAGQYTHVLFTPEDVDCIVFWTKNPAPMLDMLPEIDRLGYAYYFQFTLTPYDGHIERNVPPKQQGIETFHRLAEYVGPQRVVWRYDPVLLCPGIDIAYHLHHFAQMAHALAGYTQQCIFSFVDYYAKLRAPFAAAGIRPFSAEDISKLVQGFAAIAEENYMELAACCETWEDTGCTVARASCIDAKRIEKIIGCSIRAKPGAQRPGCGCVESVDIGSYDSCTHGCMYCYANRSLETARHNRAMHDPCAPVLFGTVDAAAVVTQKKLCSLRDARLRLF